MPKSAPSADKPAAEIVFSCGNCRVEGKAYTFRAAPARVADDPEAPHHPWRYFSPCPSCAAECEQAPYQRALFRAWAHSTGPKTDEGKAKTAENLKGHPTPDEALLTRFNAMQHGMAARVATYFPAKPDGYAFCSSCKVDREWCAKQPACVKRAETFLLHHAAFDQRKPEILNELRGDMHAAVFSVVQQILQTIMADGVRLKAPVWYSDKEGGLHFVKVESESGSCQIFETNAHPLLKSLAELLKATGLSLSDLGQTVKVADAMDQAEMGQLRHGQRAPESIEDFQKKIEGQLAGLRDVAERARLSREADPVLLEYNRESGAYEAAPPPAAKP